MHPGKLLVIGLTATTIIVSSCAKKQNDSLNASQSPTNASTQPSVSKTTEPEDIFSEFYKDENTANQKEKLTSKETFTPSGTSSSSGINNTTGTANLNSDYKADFSENGRYVIQISTVQSHAFAERIKRKLEKAGYPAYIAEVQNPVPSLSGTFYRIRIGTFLTVSAAKGFGENIIKSLGYDYWIDNKANDQIGINGNSLGNSGNNYGNFSSPATNSHNSEWGTPAPSQNNAPINTAADDWVNSAASSPASNSNASQPNSSSISSSNSGNSVPNSAATTPASTVQQTSTTPTPANSTSTVSNPSNGSNTTNTPSTTPTTPATGNTAKEGSSGWGSSGW